MGFPTPINFLECIMPRYIVLFSSFVKRFSRFLDGIAGVVLVFMMFLTCTDVFLRFFFRKPLLGTYEIVGFAGAIVAAFAIPQTTIERGHVAVRFLIERLPPKFQEMVYLIVHFLSLLLFALLSWESAVYGHDLKMGGEVSLTLKLPFYPILYGISFACAVVCLVILCDILFILFVGPLDWYHRWEDS